MSDSQQEMHELAAEQQFFRGLADQTAFIGEL
jgi:hypothetical protein